ncbi:unnamed protein product [Linum trigynum]|uniref:Chitin-binding type-1 domain-containing protein n=1 Tax=Linum trigynum TaxID=586398 RepID=A0AAV2DLC4_9ROSI
MVMERRHGLGLHAIDHIAATIIAFIILQIVASSCTAERADHRCGQYPNQTWATCDSGRCCSRALYCGDTYKHCNLGFCWYQCREVPSPDSDRQSDLYDQVAETGGGALTRLVNATYNDNPYLNLNVSDGDHELLKVQAADNASSSSSSSSPSSSSLLSCERSLSRLPLASRYKYPFAALRAPQLQNNITTATRCGRCLKVTNLGVRGLPNQVKVRIAHEHNKQGLELDFNTFKKLDINGSTGIAEGRLLVKYQFDSC